MTAAAGPNGAVPVVDLGLEFVAPGHQVGVARPEVGQYGLQGTPELVDLDTRTRQGLDRDEFIECWSDLKRSGTHGCVS